MAPSTRRRTTPSAGSTYFLYSGSFGASPGVRTSLAKPGLGCQHAVRVPQLHESEPLRASERAASASIRRDTPAISRFTPTSVPMAHTEPDGQVLQIMA